MIKALESYNKKDLMKMAGRTSIVRKENSVVSDDFTVTKKATATISKNFVALQNSFNIILANSINIKALQEAQAKKATSSSLSEGIVAPSGGKIVGAEELSGTINVLGKYFEQLTKLFDNLDITPPKEDDEEDGVSKKGKGRKSKGRRRSRNMRGRGPLGKALGIFDTALDVADDVIDEGDEPVVERGRSASRGILKGAAISVGIAGAGYLASKAFSSKPSIKETEADKRLKQSVAKTASVPAARVPSPINNNSYSSRFADYLADTFENVKSYIGGIVGSIFGGDDDGGDYYPDDGGAGEGMTGNAQIAMNYFTSPEGGEWTMEQAAGIIANLQAESGLNPNAFNSAGGGQGAVGIAQWRGERQTRFQQTYGKPIRGSSLQEQLAYVNWEFNNTETKAATALRQATTVEQATDVFYRLYERAGSHDRSFGKRISNARAIMEVANNPGNPDGVGLVSPLPGVNANSEFGNRMHPTLGVRKMHNGLDFPADEGTPILAAGSGTVVSAAAAGTAGNQVIIDHGGGISTKYMHMSAFSVKTGAQVNQGQIIGRVGSTGRSTGPHLHFEVLRNGRPENPRAYLNVKPLTLEKVFGPTPMARDPAKARKYFESLRGSPRRGNGSLIMMNNQPAPYSPSSFFPNVTPKGGTRSSNPSFADFYSSYHGVNK
jgi:murein DD-endopeptidase MepM/ murein hydrolase activator NlpD